MDVRKEPIVSACLILLFYALRWIYPESAIIAGMVVGLLLIVRALHVYWQLLGSVDRDSQPVNGIEGDMTGLYMLVRFYKQHGWPALMGTLGNVVVAGLIFLISLLSAPAV